MNLRSVRARPRTDRATATTTHGNHKRFRIREFQDGSARVYFRQPWFRRFQSGSAWVFVGEFATLAEAENVVRVFMWTVEKFCDVCEIKTLESNDE